MARRGSMDESSTGGPWQAARRIALSPYVSVVLAMFFWAGSTVIVRWLREDLPPMGLSFWRTLFGALIVLPFVIGPLRAQAHILRRNWKILALLGFLLFVGGNAILFLSLQYTFAINAAVINSVEPVLILVVAWFMFRDPVTRRQGFGVMVSLAGVMTLISRGDLSVLAAMDFNRGDILVLGAYMSWAFYAVLLRRAPSGLDRRLILLIILAFGALFLVPFYAIETAIDRPMPVTWTAVMAVVFLALFSAVAAVLMWNRAIAALGSGRAGLFIHLIPAFTVLMAVALLDEELHLFHASGIVLIAIGIYFSTLSGRRPKAH